MLDAGECLIDDLRVRRDPDGAAVELLRNGSLKPCPPAPTGGSSATTPAARVIEEPGNQGNHVLKFAATGPAETNHNHAETTFVNNAALTSGLHEISFRARWLSGTNQLNVRAYYQKLAKTWELPIPSRLGTPGAPTRAPSPTPARSSPTSATLPPSPPPAPRSPSPSAPPTPMAWPPPPCTTGSTAPTTSPRCR
jgi:hypothetical protein